MKVSKQFYNVFYSTPTSGFFKIHQILSFKNFEKNESNLRNLIIEEMKNSIEFEKSKAKAFEKQIHFQKNWMKKYNEKTSLVGNPFSTKIQKKIDELLKDFQVLSFKSTQVSDFSTTEMKCVVRFQGAEFTFHSMNTYDKNSTWSVQCGNEKLIIFDIDSEYTILEFYVSVGKFLEEFDLTELEMIDLFNEMADLLIEIPDFYYSNSGSYHDFHQ